MNLLDNPLVWIWRFRHRCGYGVHSPFAFRFLTDVVYEHTPYYAYAELDAHLPWNSRMRRRKDLHLLFRLANWLQPTIIVTPADATIVQTYLQAGCKNADIQTEIPASGADMILIREPDDRAAHSVRAGGMLVLDNLQHHREWFAHLPATLTFDLYDVGVAIYDNQFNKQHYIVNF